MLEVDARVLLREAGLTVEAEGPFEPVFSYSNDVWLGPTSVLRVCRDSWQDHYQSRYWAAAHEQEVLAWLPASVPHATVLASGKFQGRPWLLFRRVQGEVFGRVWPTLNVRQRRKVTLELGQAFRALHGMGIPDGWQRPDLEPAVLSLRQTVREIAAPYQPPLTHIAALAHVALELPNVDRGLVEAARDFVEERLPLFEHDPKVLVHSDAHWENLMVHHGELTALLDFEAARSAAPDLELDVLLRFCRWPHLPVAADYEELMRPDDFRKFPEWLAEGYPELFAGPHLRERLETYAVIHDLRQGLYYPEREGEGGPPWSPWNRLRETIRGSSYIQDWI